MRISYCKSLAELSYTCIFFTKILFVCLFGVYRPTRDFFHSNGDVNFTGEGLQIFYVCSALVAYEQ